MFPAINFHTPNLLGSLRTLGMNSRITHEGVLSAARDIQERMERIAAHTVVSSSASVTSSSSTYSSVTALTATSASRSSSTTNEKGSHYVLNLKFKFDFNLFGCFYLCNGSLLPSTPNLLTSLPV